MKLFNEHITGLEYMILYDDTHEDARLVYKERPLTVGKNKECYD